MESLKNKQIVVSGKENIVPVSEIKPKQENVAITVRVVRSWEVFLPRTGEKPAAVEMVLVDNKGTKIAARLEKSHMYKFHKMLTEGSVVTLSNFSVLPATGGYRPTQHECKLNLRFHSVIVPMPASAVDSPPYRFTPPEECFSKDFKKNFLVDVVGVYVSNGEETEFPCKGKTSTRMTIDLQNQGFPFTVTLFGEYTSQMKQFLKSGDVAGAVIAVLFCKVGTWTGGTSIQTTQRSSRLLFNPDIVELNVLRESQAMITPPVTVTRRGQSQTEEYTFLTMDQGYTLADIRELMEVEEFVSVATINSIVEGVEWWYWACREDHYKCKAEEDAPGLFYCPKCETHVERVVRSLILKLRLYDHTEVITVTLFDNAVKMLTGRPAQEVYLKWKQDPGKSGYPTEFTRLIGREAIWRIKAVQKEEDAFDRSYKVTRVSFAEEVISKYREKWGIEATIEATKQDVLLLEDTPSGGCSNVTKSASGGVTEDVLERLEDSASGSATVADSYPLVDLSNDKDEALPVKRKAAIDETSSCKEHNKTIKIESEPTKGSKIPKLPTKSKKIEK